MRRERSKSPGGHGASELDILILGPVPPPLGGVSVHLSRLVPLLQAEGLNVAVLNHFGSAELPFVVGALKRNPLNYYRLPRSFPTRILHYHHSRWLHLIAFVLGNGRRDVRRMLTLHAGDISRQFRELTSRNPLVKWMTHRALGRFDTIIVVDPKIASALREHLDRPRIEVLPAFVEAAGELPPYDSPLESFLDDGPVLVVAAYGVLFLDDGTELYGLDTVVSAFIRLAADRPDLRMAIFIARRPTRRKPRRFLAGLERVLEEAGVRERVHIAFGLPLLPAFRNNAFFVRPTRAEGDALSVREAQRAGVPVIASDVVERPGDVITFPTGDVTALCAALTSVLEAEAVGRPPSPDHIDATAEGSFAADLIRIYRDELGRRPPATA